MDIPCNRRPSTATCGQSALFARWWSRCVPGGLKARTVNKYVEYIKQVVKSLKARNGEPVYKRTWDAETMDLPIVEVLGAEATCAQSRGHLGTHCRQQGQEQVLYVFLAATGMRISEALALETRHFINGGRTIKVEQQVEKDCRPSRELPQDRALRSEKLTCTRTLQSTCTKICRRKEWVGISTPDKELRISTIIL